MMTTMIFEFKNSIPAESAKSAILISGEASAAFPGKAFLILKNEDAVEQVFQISYEYYCGPFTGACIVDDLLAVGYSGYFYLYDLSAGKCLRTLKVDSYFSGLAIHEGCFYVAGAGSVYCINKRGETVWQNNNLGVDGVRISHIADNQLRGSGEWDPPGGWREFVLDLTTGRAI